MSFNILARIYLLGQLGLVEDPVIEAIARLEFQDGLRTVVLPGGCWYPCAQGSILNPTGARVTPEGHVDIPLVRPNSYFQSVKNREDINTRN